MKMPTRRAMLCRTVAATSAFCGMPSVFAQASGKNDEDAYPTHVVKIVVPFPPAGSTDIIARDVADRVGRLMGQSFIIDNRPGASANIGAAYVARSTPDGYTLLLGTSSTQAVNAHLFASPGYDGIKDFAPVSLLVKVPTLIVINPALPVRTLADLIAYSKGRAPLPYGHPSIGSSKHFAAEIFRLQSGAQITPVPYKGSAPMLTDLLGGQIMIAFDEPLTSMEYVKAGKLVPLAVTGPARWPTLPDVPHVSELGGSLADYDVTGWFGILAPAATPPRVVQQLNRSIVKAYSDKTFRDLLYSRGAQPIGSSSEEYQAFIGKEFERYGNVIRTLHMKVE